MSVGSSGIRALRKPASRCPSVRALARRRRTSERRRRTRDAVDTWHLLRPYLARTPARLAGAAVCTIVATVACAGHTLAVEVRDRPARPSAIDEVPFALDRSDVVFVAAVLGLVLAIAALNAAASYFSEFWLNRAGERIVHSCGWPPTPRCSACRCRSTPSARRATC